jgi:ribose transport system permease protein
MNRDAAQLKRSVARFAIVLATIVLAGVFAITITGFLTTANFEDMASVVPVSMLSALGLMIPLAAGDFDLSVGPVLGIAGALLVFLNVLKHQNIVLSILITLVAAILMGVANGTLVVVFKLNALIATLATGTIFAGLTLVVLNNQTVSGVSSTFQNVTLASVVGVPDPFIGVLLLAAVLWFLHQHTPIGRQLTMAGEGRDAARLTGIRVDRIRFASFVIAALFYGVAGIVLIGQIGAADPTSGSSYTLPAFAAAFLGATAIQMGRFNVWGTVIAICFVEIGVTGLALLGLQSWIVQVFQGGVLLVAVGFARFASSSSGSLRRSSSSLRRAEAIQSGIRTRTKNGNVDGSEVDGNGVVTETAV